LIKVIFSYAQSDIIELEIRKAPATAGALSSLKQATAGKSFAGTILAVSPLLAQF
jgi:hypothetical protein